METNEQFEIKLPMKGVNTNAIHCRKKTAQTTIGYVTASAERIGEVGSLGNCTRMKELPINSQGILKVDTIGLSGPCAIVISSGKAKVVDLPFHADVKITTYKGKVTRVNWGEGEPF